MTSIQTEREQEVTSDETLALAVPHQKGPLTTPAGRLVERASYGDLFLAALIGLLTSTTYFALASKGHALNIEKVSFGDAAYFSLVTFTSLGYGDLNPQGFGRVVAVALVLMGLVLVALLVGKFASERQQSLLLLLHTSDCQRRINEFSMRLQRAVEELETAAEANQLETLKRRSKDLSAGFEAVSNYLVFNANQARLIEFGNESALVALYGELEKVQRICISIHKSKVPDQILARRTLAITNRTAALINLMKAFHHHAGQKQSYTSLLVKRMRRSLGDKPVFKMSPLAIRVATIQSRMGKEAELLKHWVRSTYTPAIADAVWHISPTGLPASWPKGLHKTLAVQLGISNRLAQKALDELLNSGRLPKSMKGEAVHVKNASDRV